MKRGPVRLLCIFLYCWELGGGGVHTQCTEVEVGGMVRGQTQGRLSCLVQHFWCYILLKVTCRNVKCYISDADISHINPQKHDFTLSHTFLLYVHKMGTKTSQPASLCTKPVIWIDCQQVHLPLEFTETVSYLSVKAAEGSGCSVFPAAVSAGSCLQQSSCQHNDKLTASTQPGPITHHLKASTADSVCHHTRSDHAQYKLPPCPVSRNYICGF